MTNAHSSKIQNCFDHDEESRGFTVKRLIERVESKDITGDELFIGGEVTKTAEGVRLKELGANVFTGVRAAADAARARVAGLHDEFKVVAPKNGSQNGG